MTERFESHGYVFGALLERRCKDKEDHQPHQWYVYSDKPWDIDPYSGQGTSWGPYFCPGVNPIWNFKDSTLYYINRSFYIRTKDGWLRITFEDARLTDREVTALMEDGRVKEL